MDMVIEKLTFVLGADAHECFFGATDAEMSQAEVYKFMTPVFGKGVVYDAPQRIMQEQLKFMRSSINTTNLQKYVPIIIDEANKYFAQWGESGEINLLDELSQLIILTASATLMGPEIRQHLFTQVADLYHQLDEGITPLSVFFPNAPLPGHLRRNAAREAMVKLFGDVIKSRRDKGQRHDDVLQVFMEAKYRNGETLSDQQVTGLMIALLFAGQHTSSITSTWTALNLLKHPELMAEVMDELHRVLPADTSNMNYDQVVSLDLLKNCMKESIRMYPPLIMLMRKVKKDTKCGKYIIPAGDIIVASPAVSMSLPQPDGSFTNPEKYDPHRYDEDRKEDAGKFAYVGFGGGLHACMGERFGYLQVTTILSVLLSNFELEMVEPELPQPDYKAMVVGPEGQHTRVRFRRKK